MYPFIQRLVSEHESKAAMQAGNLVRFDASCIVRAIVFHLLDDKTFDAVNPTSVKAAIKVLSSRMNIVTISADEWAQMDNASRLKWLLDQSNIYATPTSPRIASLALADNDANPFHVD